MHITSLWVWLYLLTLFMAFGFSLFNLGPYNAHQCFEWSALELREIFVCTMRNYWWFIFILNYCVCVKFSLWLVCFVLSGHLLYIFSHFLYARDRLASGSIWRLLTLCHRGETTLYSICSSALLFISSWHMPWQSP